MRGRLRDARRERSHRRAFGREEDLDGSAVTDLRQDRIVEQRRDRNLAAHQRVGGRRVGGKQQRLGRGLLLPVVLGDDLTLEHRARPGGAARRRDHLADLLVAVFGLGEIHPGLRRVFHQLAVVGDGPDDRRARPQLRRDARLRDVVGGVRRRVVLEQVRDLEHQRAVGMIDDVGEQLSGGGLGLDALKQLVAWRAQELDLDERKALVERLDHRLLAFGDVRRIEHELAFLLGGFDQLGRAELGVRRDGKKCESKGRGDVRRPVSRTRCGTE